MTIAPPTSEELNALRKDAGEGDSTAVTALKRGPEAEAALKRWREMQQLEAA